MKVEYHGELISVYQLGKRSGVPLSSLYRAYRKGLRNGDDLIREATKHLIDYQGERITTRQLCLKTRSDYRSVKRRLNAGVATEDAVADLTDHRGGTKSAKLSPSDVLTIYAWLFRKEKTQGQIAKAYGIHQSTVSDIWRHKCWDWITAPLRYALENEG